MFFLYLHMADENGEFFLLKEFTTLDNLYKCLLNEVDLSQIIKFRLLRDLK